MAKQYIDNSNTYDNESNFNLLFDRMPQSLILSEFDSGKIIKINKFFCTTFDYKAQEIIGKTFHDLGIWDNADHKLFINELNSHQVVNDLESSTNDKSGNQVYVLLNASLIYINNCKAVLTMLVDISRSKKLEYTLQIKKEKFESVFRNHASPIAIINPDTTIIDVNDAYCQASGYSRDEAIGMSWAQQITDDEIDRIKDSDQQPLLNKLDYSREYETYFYNKQGEKKYIHLAVSFIPETKIRIISFIEISKLMKAEYQLAKQNEELKELVASKNKEITLNLLHLSNNSQYNERLILKLNKIRKQIKSENPLFLHDIDNLIDEIANNQKHFNWNMLKEHFLLTRPIFLEVLLSKHPELTPAELELATLLSLQINTKEIARITNQQYDSVRVSRTRLRKKLRLESKKSLVAYLLGL